MSDEPAWKVRLRRLQALQQQASAPSSPPGPSASTPAADGPASRFQSPALLAAQARQLALSSAPASPPPASPTTTAAAPAPTASASAAATAAAARLSTAAPPAPAPAPTAAAAAPVAPPPAVAQAKPIPRPSSSPALPRPTPTASSSSPSTHSTPAASAPKKPTKPYTLWEAEQVGAVLNVTADVGRAEASGWQVVLLEDVAAELKSEGKPTLLLPTGSIDALLIARLSLDPSATMTDSLTTLSVLSSLPALTPTAYLIGSYVRLLPLQLAAHRAGYSPAETARWRETFARTKAAVVSYTLEVLKDPGMFPLHPSIEPSSSAVGPLELLPALLEPTHAPSSARLLSPTHLALLLSDLSNLATSSGPTDEAEYIAKVLGPLTSAVFQQYWAPADKRENQLLTGAGWDRFLGAIERVVQSKETAALMGSLPIWLLATATAPQLEFMSLLGPFLRLSTFPREFPEIVGEFFANPTERDRADIQAAQRTLQASLFTLQDRLFAILSAIVRSGPRGRETVLSLLGRIVDLNKRRAGSRVPRETVASDGFMTNVFAVVLRFAEPFTDVAFSKVDKVDPDYFVKSARIDLGDVTRLRATQAEADEYATAYRAAHAEGAEGSAPPPNFISDVFWLACAVQHVGLCKTVGTRTELERKIGDVERDVQRLEADDSWRTGGGPVREQGEALMKKLKDQLKSIHASLHAFDAQLLDPDLVARTTAFQTLVMAWFVRLVDPAEAYPAQMITLPLPDEAPLNFRMLPEYILEDIADYHVFLISHSPQTFDTSDQTKLITFVITFLSGKYVKNPFVKAKLVEFLSMGCQSWGPYRQGVLGPALAFHPLATSQLVPSLIAYYIDMEATGGHQQFYDKFSMRRHAVSILRYLLKNPVHRETFERDSIRNEDRFVVFANMHMNDCTFLLEESLTSLSKIYQLETEMAAGEAWAGLTEAERKDKTDELKAAENQAAWSTDGGRRNVAALKEWTAHVKEPFMKAEIVDRLAAMLCFNLATLVGPAMQSLKVRDPKKYRFDAKSLLGDLTDLFRQLGTEARFVEAVAREGRSYRKEVFASLARILQHRAVKTPAEIQQVVLFCDKVEETRLKIEAEEEGEDLPDEFLDPLMYTLMRDPVVLPSSKTTIDRSTIKAHLLSDPTDPFNRMPLKLEECEPDVDLKAKIEAYLADRRLRNVEPMHVDGVPDA